MILQKIYFVLEKLKPPMSVYNNVQAILGLYVKSLSKGLSKSNLR